jgi:RNA polymerase sigma-70 factor, ECF subfamily
VTEIQQAPDRRRTVHIVIFNPAVDTFSLRLPLAAFSLFQSPADRGRADVPTPVLRLQPSTATPGSENPDDALIAGLAAGDEGAAAKLYDRFAPMLMAVAFRITRSRADAEDVVLETLEQAWRQARRYETSRGSLEAWLAVIARSRAFDRTRMTQRRERRIVPLEDQPGGVLLEARDEGVSAADVAEASDASRRVAAALATLPAAQREAVELAFYDGLSHSEVAEKLGEPLGTVKTRIRLAMLKLRDMLLPFAPEARA